MASFTCISIRLKRQFGNNFLIMQSPRGAVIGKFCSYLGCTQWHKRAILL